MPVYAFKCGECGAEFTITCSMAERSLKEITCTGCGSSRVEQIYSVVSVKTEKKTW